MHLSGTVLGCIGVLVYFQTFSDQKNDNKLVHAYKSLGGRPRGRKIRVVFQKGTKTLITAQTLSETARLACNLPEGWQFIFITKIHQEIDLDQKFTSFKFDLKIGSDWCYYSKLGDPQLSTIVSIGPGVNPDIELKRESSDIIYTVLLSTLIGGYHPLQ